MKNLLMREVKKIIELIKLIAFYLIKAFLNADFNL
jgi:hypothetical protein